MMTLFMLVSLSGIIKFVDQLKKAGQGSYDALGAGMYTLLSVPKLTAGLWPIEKKLLRHSSRMSSRSLVNVLSVKSNH